MVITPNEIAVRRTLLKIIIVLMLTGLTVVAKAQQYASATASASIVNPMIATTTQEMYFGKLTAGSDAGKIVLSPSSIPAVTAGLKFAPSNKTAVAASFKITANNEAYAITVQPEPIIISSVSGKESMRIHSFNYTSSTKNLLNTRTETLLIGATLTLSSQAPQTSVSDTLFTITANYY
jgi:hypothetical protein